MQWQQVTTSNLPEPGESVLGLWADGFWKKVAYAADVGWYTSRDGFLDIPPDWWARVDSRVPKASEVGPPSRMVGVTQFRRGNVTKLSLVEGLREAVLTPANTEPETSNVTASPLALDVSLEQARALHRVWRALNDGDCPKCHKFHAATEIIRNWAAITCPSCWFHVKRAEIAAIEQMFAPAMDAAVAIFNQWRIDTRCDNCGGMLITKKTMEAHWPADFKPEGPDHVPDGFCNGLCGALGALGAVGPPGPPAAS